LEGNRTWEVMRKPWRLEDIFWDVGNLFGGSRCSFLENGGSTLSHLNHLTSWLNLMVSVYDMDITILDSGCRCVVPCDTGIQETAKIKTHQIAELQTSCKASDILKERWQMWLSATFIRNDQWSTIIDIIVVNKPFSLNQPSWR
jgi:hypothetical protein